MRKIFYSVVLVLALCGTAGAGVITVNTPADLDNVRNNLAGDYKLGGDIDLTAYISSGSGNSSATNGWLPIGTTSARFTGSFDGDGHVIKGLWVNRPDTLYIGLFGFTQNATISNLGVEIDNGKGGVVGDQSVGGLVGCQISDSGGSSVIEYCYVSGNVSVVWYNAGGLVGMQSNGAYGGSGSITIKNCYATGDVKVTNSSGYGAGGLVGEQASNSLGSSSVIENCYATGNVSAPNYAGGLVGYQYIAAGSSSGAIENCYATGNVTASKNYAGGLVGQQNTTGSRSSTIENCFAFGGVKSPGASAFALVGAQEGEGTNTIASSYRYENVKVKGAVVPATAPESAPDKLHGGVKTIGELMTKTTFTGNQWLFNDSIPTTGPWDWDSTSFPKLNIGTETFPFPSEITITSQPQSAVFIVDSISGNLSVSASVVPSGALSYQWYSNTTNSNSGGISIPGATNASFPIPVSLTVGNHYYYCVISAVKADSASSVATVKVTDAGKGGGGCNTGFLPGLFGLFALVRRKRA